MASDIQDLKLGISQSDLIKNTKTHIDTLYDQNSAQATDITNAQKKADDAYLLAAQKHKIVAYDTLFAMINELNSADVTDFNIGDEIYIKDTLYTRDFWVSAKQDTKYTNQTDEDGFKVDKFDKGYVGYFELSILDESPEVTNMVTSDENITEDNIVLGAGDKKVKSSSYSIETTLNDSGSEVPTSSAVKNAIANFATKDELANAGKVKSVSINNGTPNTPDSNGNIDLTISVSGESKPLATNIKSATLVNYPSDSNIQYKAIEMPKTSVVIEVLKKENDDFLSVVTQSIVVGDYTYYLLDKSATGEYYYREVGGNAVSGGSADITELEAKIEDLEDYVKLPFSITLEQKTITSTPKSGNVIKDTNIKIDDIIYKINGIEIQENSTLIYEKDEYGTGVLTNEDGEPLDITDSKIRVYAYVNKSNQQTVINRQFYARFINDTKTYVVNFPELTFLATSDSLNGSLEEYLQTTTLYNHFVELSIGGLSYTINGTNYTNCVARLYLNYIDNINTSTLIISEWIDSPFIKDKTGQTYIDGDSTLSCAGRLGLTTTVNPAPIIPFGIIDSYNIYLENNDFKITVDGWLSSLSGDKVAAKGNQLLSEATIIRHVVVPIKVF